MCVALLLMLNNLYKMYDTTVEFCEHIVAAMLVMGTVALITVPVMFSINAVGTNGKQTQPFVAIVVLVCGVIGGLIMVISFILFCKYCFKKKSRYSGTMAPTPKKSLDPQKKKQDYKAPSPTTPLDLHPSLSEHFPQPPQNVDELQGGLGSSKTKDYTKRSSPDLRGHVRAEPVLHVESETNSETFSATTTLADLSEDPYSKNDRNNQYTVSTQTPDLTGPPSYPSVNAPLIPRMSGPELHRPQPVCKIPYLKVPDDENSRDRSQSFDHKENHVNSHDRYQRRALSNSEETKYSFYPQAAVGTPRIVRGLPRLPLRSPRGSEYTQYSLETEAHPRHHEYASRNCSDSHRILYESNKTATGAFRDQTKQLRLNIPQGSQDGRRLSGREQSPSRSSTTYNQPIVDRISYRKFPSEEVVHQEQHHPYDRDHRNSRSYPQQHKPHEFDDNHRNGSALQYELRLQNDYGLERHSSASLAPQPYFGGSARSSRESWYSTGEGLSPYVRRRSNYPPLVRQRHTIEMPFVMISTDDDIDLPVEFTDLDLGAYDETYLPVHLADNDRLNNSKSPLKPPTIKRNVKSFDGSEPRNDVIYSNGDQYPERNALSLDQDASLPPFNSLVNRNFSASSSGSNPLRMVRKSDFKNRPHIPKQSTLNTEIESHDDPQAEQIKSQCEQLWSIRASLSKDSSTETPPPRSPPYDYSDGIPRTIKAVNVEEFNLTTSMTSSFESNDGPPNQSDQYRRSQKNWDPSAPRSVEARRLQYQNIKKLRNLQTGQPNVQPSGPQLVVPYTTSSIDNPGGSFESVDSDISRPELAFINSFESNVSNFSNVSNSSVVSNNTNPDSDNSADSSRKKFSEIKNDSGYKSQSADGYSGVSARVIVDKTNIGSPRVATRNNYVESVGQKAMYAAPMMYDSRHTSFRSDYRSRQRLETVDSESGRSDQEGAVKHTPISRKISDSSQKDGGRSSNSGSRYSLDKECFVDPRTNAIFNDFVRYDPEYEKRDMSLVSKRQDQTKRSSSARERLSPSVRRRIQNTTQQANTVDFDASGSPTQTGAKARWFADSPAGSFDDPNPPKHKAPLKSSLRKRVQLREFSVESSGDEFHNPRRPDTAQRKLVKNNGKQKTVMQTVNRACNRDELPIIKLPVDEELSVG